MSQPLIRDVQAIAESLLTQPALFSIEEDLYASAAPSPEAMAVVGRGQYSGERITADESRCLLIGALRELGLSDRKISEIAGCARESIPVVVEHLERLGRIRPLKERLERWTGLLAESTALTARELVERIREGKTDVETSMALRALGPMLGISIERYQTLTGQASQIIETRDGGDPRRELEDWMRKVYAEAAPVPSPESESGGKALITEVLDENQSVESRLESATPAPTMPGDLAPTPQGGEGGSAAGGGGPGADESTGAKNISQGPASTPPSPDV